MSAHPADRLAAIEWAIALVLKEQAAVPDALGSLYLAALREMRDEAQREARA